jgi:hypothetical protein
VGTSAGKMLHFFLGENSSIAHDFYPQFIYFQNVIYWINEELRWFDLSTNIPINGCSQVILGLSWAHHGFSTHSPTPFHPFEPDLNGRFLLLLRPFFQDHLHGEDQLRGLSPKRWPEIRDLGMGVPQ